MEPLTSKNCWLEVKVKRQGFEAEWEKLGEAEVPEDILAAFVKQTHASQAIPVPGEKVHSCIPHAQPLVRVSFQLTIYADRKGH